MLYPFPLLSLTCDTDTEALAWILNVQLVISKKSEPIPEKSSDKLVTSYETCFHEFMINGNARENALEDY